jgi:hypothetical protein
MRHPLVALACLLVLVVSSARRADAKPAPIAVQLVDFYEIEERALGDGAALVVVDDEVPEPLFITSSRRHLIVWWRARHRCDRLVVPRAHIEKKRTLVLSVSPVTGKLPCAKAATIMETRVARPPTGVWQLRAEAEGRALPPLFFTVPSDPRPADFDNVQRRVPETDALRRIGERVAWTYHHEAKSKPAIAAYRWLISLDELHWRAPLYHARVFANIAVTRSKGGAVTSLEQMMAGLANLRRELDDPNTPAWEAKKREWDALRAWLEPSLRFFARRWHKSALTRMRPARAAYKAYLELFGDHENAAEMRYYFAGLLLFDGDDLLAKEQMGRAAQTLKSEKKKTMAAACLVALAMEERDDDLLRPCRQLKPSLPPIDLLPDIGDERFARPKRDED